MAGLVPAIHVLLAARSDQEDVDARDKRGHDGVWGKHAENTGPTELAGTTLLPRALRLLNHLRAHALRQTRRRRYGDRIFQAFTDRKNMKTSIAVAAALLLFVANARAESEHAFAALRTPGDGIRITSQLRAAVVLTEDGLDAKAGEVARRSIYVMAESECAALSEVFKTECRLVALSLGYPSTGKSPMKGILAATATYHLGKKSADTPK